ncbi:MAG: mandelate racemase/muconate lactonizing enzyme family protein, partial [uncultured Nocardioidaceae bacterium]
RRRRHLPGARRHQLRRRNPIHEDRAPGRGLQPAGHLARRARRHGPPARRGAQPLLPRGARLRARPLHRRAPRDRGGLRGRAEPARPRRRVRLEGPRRHPRL